MTPRKIASFAIGPIGGAIISLITLPTITWFFSQEDVGKLAMLQLAVGFSTLFFSLGLDQAYVREYHEFDGKPRLLKMALIPGFILLMIILMILISRGGVLSAWLFDIPSRSLSMLIAISLLAAFVSRFLSLVLRMEERGLAFSMSQLLPKLLLLFIVVSYVAFNANKDLFNLILANTAALFFVAIVFTINTRQEWLAAIGAPSDWQLLKQMLKFGFPLVLGGVAYWGLTGIDKIFLRSLSGYGELAVYSVAVAFAGVATILQSIFSIVWAPTVYKWVSKNHGLENVNKVSRYMLLVVVLVFCLGGIFSWLVTLVLPSNYHGVRWLIIPSLGAPLLYALSETTVVGIGVSRKSIFALIASIVALVTNIVGNWLLIPLLGAAGAAISTCFSFWVFFILRTEFSCYLWQPIPRQLMYFYTGLVVLFSSIHAVFGELYSLWILFGWIALFGCCIFQFKRELFSTYAWVYNKIY